MPVELAFIHGWGFDARFWDALATRLSEFKQHRVDLGFFTESPATEIPEAQEKILIGHSLGFVHGIKRGGWKGWIAINSFTRFVATNDDGCIPAPNLREMRLRLQKDPTRTLQGFYKMIGVESQAGTPNVERLRDGLDELRDSDISSTLSSLNIPGLVLAGGDDPLVPRKTSEKLGGYARQFVLNETGGHLLLQSAPNWCAKAIADFVVAHFG